jgi:hypothetical protein
METKIVKISKLFAESILKGFYFIIKIIYKIRIKIVNII